MIDVPFPGNKKFEDLPALGNARRLPPEPGAKDRWLWRGVEVRELPGRLRLPDGTDPGLVADLEVLVERLRNPPEHARDVMRGRIAALIEGLEGKDVRDLDAGELRRIVFLLLWDRKGIAPQRQPSGGLKLALRHPRDWLRRYDG